ncbi:MAG: L-serine ammonia-lyase, iron-sulfur-dependent, subunit alpha [Lachnospiraceae bacterium]
MAFGSLEEIIEICKEKKKSFWEVILEDDMNERNVPREDSVCKMSGMWSAMKEEVRDYEEKIESHSGLVGGMGGRMEHYVRSQKPLCGEFVGEVIATALKTGESNACMKRIVAAPTAGACGVLPAVLVPYYKKENCGEEKAVEAMYVAAGIGQVIAARAFIAGAAGGCQAEIGSASAMAAGALVHLKGGDAVQIAQAAAMALKNLLGLVCDPVAGLVEVPCVKRNVIGAVNALSCADMALAGISSRIPPDQVIDAMREVGEKMHDSLKETAEGGIANTTEAKKIAEQLAESEDSNEMSINDAG